MPIITHPTDENLRIHVSRDEYPSKPYNDGGFPIWRIESGRYGSYPTAEQETDLTSYVTPGELDHAIGRLLGEHGSGDEGKEILARYLRIFWGVTFMEMWHSGSYWYFTCDPAHWREHVGVTDEVTQREDYAANPFDEFQAWVEGNVWIATAQRRIFVRSHHLTWDLAAGYVPDETDPSDDDTTDGYRWVPDDSVGGFYGDVDEVVRTAMLWQFGWPSHVCQHCGEGIVNDVNHGWVVDGPPFEDRGRFTHCAKGVMMHVRGPKHEPKTPDPIEED
jgi:hypothetical protein